MIELLLPIISRSRQTYLYNNSIKPQKRRDNPPKFIQIIEGEKSFKENICRFGSPGGSITLIQRNKDQAYLGEAKVKAEINNSFLNKQVIVGKILALQNEKPVDLCKPITYNENIYSSSQIRYLFMIDLKWDSIMKGIRKLDLYPYTLAIIFDESCQVFDTSVMRKNPLTGEQMEILNININPLIIQVRQEISWLREAGAPLQLKLEHFQQVNFGFCGNNILYPVLEERIKRHSKSNILINYDYDTPEHKIGDATVNKISSALNQLMNVSTFTPEKNSDADIKFKWDLIIKIDDKCYPIQVKSSQEAAKIAHKEYKNLYARSEIPFIPVIIWTDRYGFTQNMAEEFSRVFNIPLKNSPHNSSTAVTPDLNKLLELLDQIPALKYLFSLTNALMDVAKEGKWDSSIESKLEEIAMSNTNPAYRLIQHCRLIANARNQQADFLEQQNK